MQFPFLQEPLPVVPVNATTSKESLLRAVKHFIDPRYYWNIMCQPKPGPLYQSRLFPLVQKAIALWAGAPCQLFWESGTGWEGCMCLRSHSFAPGQPCAALLLRSAVTIVAPFSYSSLVLHAPLTVAFILWAGICFLYVFRLQKGSQTVR